MEYLDMDNVKQINDKKANLRDLIAATGLVSNQIDFKISISWPVWCWNLIDDLEKQ